LTREHGFIQPVELISFIRDIYKQPAGNIPLHAPLFRGREKEYLAQCVDSTFVSSIGPFVTRFEEMIRTLTGAACSVATINGTSALHAALLASGIRPGEEVITQPLSFVATANAIFYGGGRPVFLDVDRDTLGLSPEVLETFFQKQTVKRADGCFNRVSGSRIAACVPMHTFGHPCRIARIVELCTERGVPVIEDAAEALGSFYRNRSCGTFGLAGIFSFNGNKIITCGGGGVIVTDDPEFGARARHLTSIAKKPHPYLYEHTEVGFNYRMPNLNAALGCAQLEMFDALLAAKRALAGKYQGFFAGTGYPFMQEPVDSRANYWLNTLFLRDRAERDRFLSETHQVGILTRPAWTLLNRLPMYDACQTDGLANAMELSERLINLPSSVPP
jgi:perosamine synthetase